MRPAMPQTFAARAGLLDPRPPAGVAALQYRALPTGSALTGLTSLEHTPRPARHLQRVHLQTRPTYSV